MNMTFNLYDAVMNGDVKECKRCIEAGADVNYIGGRRPLLHEAIDNNMVDCARVLIEAGADCMAVNEYGEIPLHWAQSVEAIKLLLLENNRSAGIDHKSYDGYTPLQTTIMNKSRECVELLIESGASVNSKANDGGTLLWTAIVNNQYDYAKTLLDNGADINMAGGNARMTTLHRAIKANNKKGVEFLVDNGANIMIENADFMNAADLAIDLGHKSLLKIIRKNKYQNVKGIKSMKKN